MEYTGERISRKETGRRTEEQGRIIYLFTLYKYWTLDCISRRAIPKGEELTLDYCFAKDTDPRTVQMRIGQAPGHNQPYYRLRQGSKEHDIHAINFRCADNMTGDEFRYVST
jgi:hypothetical protein